MPSHSSQPDASTLDLKRRLAFAFQRTADLRRTLALASQRGADVLERSARLADQHADRRARQGDLQLPAIERERATLARAAARRARAAAEHFSQPAAPHHGGADLVEMLGLAARDDTQAALS